MADKEEAVETATAAADVAKAYLQLMSQPLDSGTMTAMGLVSNTWATLALVEATEKQTEAIQHATEYLVAAIERGK